MRNIGKVLLLSTSLLVGEVVSPVIPASLQQAHAAGTIKLANISYQTTANVNLRTGPATKYKAILLIPKSKIVTATEQTGSWVKVTYIYTLNGKKTTKTGWVTASYIKKISTAPKSVKFAKTTYQTTDNVNIRSGASTKHKTLKTIPKGKTIISAEKFTDWYKVTYSYPSKGKNVLVTGWVKSTFLKEYYKYSTIPGGYYFPKNTVKLYDSPDTKKSAVYSLTSGNGLYSANQAVNSLGQTWFKVSYNGKTLYVYSGDVSKYILTSFAETEYQAKLDTYLYVSYGKTYTKLVEIPKQTLISVNQRIGDWYKISFNGKSGYVYSGDFTKNSKPAEDPVEEPEEEVTARVTYLVIDKLNLRESANTTATILMKIPRGTIVIPTSKTANGWYKVSSGGEIGYVFGSYLQQVITGDPLGNKDSYQFIDLRTQSLVTSSQIDRYIAGYVNAAKKTSILTGKGQLFINAGEKYGINALYLAAHAIHESAYGTSAISMAKNNLFGFGAYDAAPFISAYRFESVESSIDFIAREMKTTYLNPDNWKYRGAYLGFSTKTLTNARIEANSEGMNFFYASDPNWGKTISQHMQKMHPYDKSYYAHAIVNTDKPTRLAFPAGSDLFPVNIVATAKKDLSLFSEKGGKVAAGVIGTGKTFMLLEKMNDYWLRVKFNNKEYWTRSVVFSNYKSYLSVRNLGRVTVSGLNLRTGPATTNSSIGTLSLNDYVSIVMKADGSLMMDASKSWYQLKMESGTTAWVSASYLYTKDLQ
jgi:beta-N-acetylglucosaminidase